MKLSLEVNRLATGLLIAFSVVTITAAYWAVVGPDTITQRQDNPRLVEQEGQIHRGDIQDRNGTTLVTSIENSDRSVSRHYLFPEMNSALGYASLRYGVSGAESAFNSILRGDDLGKDFFDQLAGSLLHRAQRGSDIRVTLDLDIQKTAVDAFGNFHGSAVVIEVPSGAILAMVSLPTFDPNTLDADWEDLTRADGNPFFNRALQGGYQPGGVLQTPLLAAALLADYPIDNKLANVAEPVQIDKLTLRCLETPLNTSLSLAQSYAFGCPFPFENLILNLGSNRIQQAFKTFRFSEPPTLPGYVILPADETNQTTITPTSDASDYLANALGQGRITVTPLEMAVFTAAILNDGNAPTPYTLFQIHRSDRGQWIDAIPSNTTIPLMTASVSHQVRDLMKIALATGAVQAMQRSELDNVGGHIAVAYTGDSTQVWFIGFAGLQSNSGVAMALVLESTDGTDQVAEIGESILATAISKVK
ncbi:MAG: penicillin-binding transpeptidase domain-containing protein [Anaerolineae bacterium]